MANTLTFAQTAPIGKVLGQALDAGVRFRFRNGKVQVTSPARSNELLVELKRQRTELLPIFQQGPGNAVSIGETEFSYAVWSGQSLRPAFALDTETRRIESPDVVPELAMATASDGQSHYVIHPSDLPAFLVNNAEATMYCHNSAFDFWVIHHHLRSDLEAQQTWWRVVDEGRLRDSMLLDALYRLAKRDAFPKPRDLATLAHGYTELTVDKSDPFRLRYGSIIGKPWSIVPRGFFDYAIKDAIVTFVVYEELLSRVRKLLSQYAPDDDSVRRWGYLTEQIQVQGAISLAAVECHGVQIDRRFLRELWAGLEQQRAELLKWLDSEAPGLFKRDKRDELIVSSRTGTPSQSHVVLSAILESIADQLGEDPPRSEKQGRITTSRDYWQQFDHLPFVANWIALKEISKLLSFFRQLDADKIHPRYSVMVRTGRTSCHSPNIQQLPRSGHLREAIVAPAGHSLYVVDYSYIELRTLAAVCQARYGHSKLAQIIREGVDPHCYTAAMFEGVPFEEFMSWKRMDGDRFSQLRQRAKAINFGIPGGLGAKTLVQYARTTYGVDLSLDDAETFRNKLINEVFPELKRYLSEDAYGLAAQQLWCAPEQLRAEFKKASHLGCMRRIIRGEGCMSGTKEAYSDERIETVWSALERLNRNPELSDAIAARDTTDDVGLARRLFGCPIATLTGRIRGGVGFTAARNTPFSGLAADGAKLALYQLVRHGYTVNAFIHDEFVLTLRDDADWINEPKRIDNIVCSAMRSVCRTVPIAVEGVRVKRWHKQAKPIRHEQTDELLLWEPAS